MSFYDFSDCKITIHHYNINGIFSNAKIIHIFMEKKLKLIAITGPTATGKTSLGVKLAEFFDGEIISLDSRQLYKYMDLGTGKDLEEYGNIPYHLIDIAHPSEIIDLAEVLRRIQTAIDDISSRNKHIILCGGTALYLESILQRRTMQLAQPDFELRVQLDKLDLAELTEMIKNEFPAMWDSLNADDRCNPLRIRRKIELAVTPVENTGIDAVPPWRDFDILTIGVYYPRAVVRENIRRRLSARFEAGMTDEIRQLHDVHGVSWERIERFGLEYREIARFLQNKATEAEMYDTLLNKIRQFAKRQDIFFRKIEREGHNIYWLKGQEDIFGKSCNLIRKFLNDESLPPVGFKLSDITN